MPRLLLSPLGLRFRLLTRIVPGWYAAGPSNLTGVPSFGDHEFASGQFQADDLNRALNVAARPEPS